MSGVGDKAFTLFWMGGQLEVVDGSDLEDAFRRAGYNERAVKALVFCKEGDHQDAGYAYDDLNNAWVPPNGMPAMPAAANTVAV